jgi:hypothetical protein
MTRYVNILVMPSFFELKNISFVLYRTITVSAILVVGVTSTVDNFEVARAQVQSDLDAASVYDSGQMKLGNNVKHLVIVIPNEGHHGPGEADEARFIDQPFIPQNATVASGTQVVWFNGDVGHEHNIVVRDSTALCDRRTYRTSGFKTDYFQQHRRVCICGHCRI